MRPLTSLVRALCVVALVTGVAGCDEPTASPPPKGTVVGTIASTKGFLAPPVPVAVRADAAPVARPLAAKAPGQRAALPAVVRPSGGRARGPAFTPDELLVTFRPSAVAAPPVGSRALASPVVAAAVASAIRSRLAGFAAQGRAGVRGVSPALLAARLVVADPSRIEEVAAQLRADPAVATVERNGIVWASRPRVARAGALGTYGNDPIYPVQSWHYEMIDAPQAWDLTRGSENVVVAVVDDGKNDHPDIVANLTADGYDFVSSGTLSLCGGAGGTTDRTGDADGYDADPTDPASYDYDPDLDCVEPSVLGNHGLHVAGTIGAVGNNGLGVTGVNWTVRIRPVRVLNVAGFGTDYDVAQGIMYAAGLPADNGVPAGTVQLPPGAGARVINLSLGGPDPSQVMEDAVINATTAGALVVVAAGNSSSSDPSYPAAYPQALSVAAVGPDGRLASYSSFGPTVDIAAPGGDIEDGFVRYGDLSTGTFSYGVLSTMWDFQADQPVYAWTNGTSMAAPHVAGVAALVLAREPQLDVVALRDRLTGFAVDVGLDERDDLYGAGIVNARNSLTQSFAPPRRLYARLYNAATGAIVATQAAGTGGAYAFTDVSDGTYAVFAGEDENGDGVLGSLGRRWGAFGGVATPTSIVVASGGTYPASFTIGLPLEREPNDAFDRADFLYVGGSLYGTTTEDLDFSRISIATAGMYTFETSGWDGACLYALEEDTVIELYDAARAFIGRNDDISASNFCSRLTQSLSAGTYYLAVYGSEGRSGGRYRVHVRAGT
jgi:subtilisin family serine protease